MIVPPFARSAEASRELRSSLTEFSGRLGDDSPAVLWYFDHWLDNGRRRNTAVLERLARAAVNLPGLSPVVGDEIVVSGRNWRGTLARHSPHYAYFEDVAEEHCGTHVETGGQATGRSSAMGSWLGSRGWVAKPLRRVLDPRLLPRVELETARLRRRIRYVDPGPFRKEFAYFCRAALPYCIWLEQSFAQFVGRVGRIWLTGETSWVGRALIRALRGKVTIIARQHGAVIPSQLDYLHELSDSPRPPVPDQMWLYDQHYREIFAWMIAGGTRLHVWADPRVSSFVDRSAVARHHRAVYLSQPLPEPWSTRASLLAQKVALQRGLQLRVRRHPVERRGAALPLGAELSVGSLAEDVLGAPLVITVYSTAALEAAYAGCEVVLLPLGQCDIRPAFPPNLPISVADSYD